MGAGVAGINGNGLLVAGDGLVPAPQFPERRAQVEMGLGMFGPDFDGPAVAFDRLIGPFSFIRATPLLL